MEKTLQLILEKVTSMESDIKAELKSINGRLDNLEGDVKGLKNDVNGLKEDVKGLKEDVKDLKQDTKQLKLGQKIILETMTYNDIDLKHTLDDIAKSLENNRLDHISFNNRITNLESKI